ncbi:hypothetical protein BDN67DRAFT_659423 [Paxillus ammoniavirescens]|nr:hypothetical protein BDN67DRAFT_659423 [Paxillus ammoniavirescens]
MTSWRLTFSALLRYISPVIVRTLLFPRTQTQRDLSTTNHTIYHLTLINMFFTKTMKKDLASVENLARSPFDDTSKKLLAKLRIRSLKNSGVPKAARSMPDLHFPINKTGSFAVDCSLLLHTDLTRPRDVVVRKVRSVKADFKQLFKVPSEAARGLSCTNLPKKRDELAQPAPTYGSGEEDPDYLCSAAAAAQSWIGPSTLLPRRHVVGADDMIEKAQSAFSQAFVDLYAGGSSISSPEKQSPLPSSSPIDLTHSFPSSLSDPPLTFASAPSSISLPSRQIDALLSLPSRPKVTETGTGVRSAEFSDEEFQKEFDNFSFHTVDEEEWTSGVEARKQNELNRLFSSMKRELAIPVPKLSSYFSDDSLAESATRALVKVQAPCRRESAREREFDNCSFYSADEEDEGEDVCDGGHGEGERVSVTSAPESAIVSACHSAPSLSSQLDISVTVKQRDLRDPGAEIPEDGTSDVWQLLATHVPRLLTRISEESLADEYEIEVIAQSPPLSFKRPSPPYVQAKVRDENQWMCQGKAQQIRAGVQCPVIVAIHSFLDCEGETDSQRSPSPAKMEITGDCLAETAYATTVVAEDSPRPSVEVERRTLCRVGRLADLKTSVLPTRGSVSSLETLCEKIAISEGACTPLEFRGPPLRRVARYSDLRKSYLRTDVLPEAMSWYSGSQRPSLRRVTQSNDLKGRFSSLIVETNGQIGSTSSYSPQVANRDVAKPPIPPKPLGLRLHRQNIQPALTAVPESRYACPRHESLSQVPLWSCAKITRSKEKRTRKWKESKKAIKKRLDSIPYMES